MLAGFHLQGDSGEVHVHVVQVATRTPVSRLGHKLAIATDQRLYRLIHGVNQLVGLCTVVCIQMSKVQVLVHTISFLIQLV